MRRTREQAAKTRESILAEALTLFADKGYSATSLAEIAERAGVTKGAIFFHFQGKEELFDSICNQQHEQMRTYFESATAEAASSLHELRLLLTAVVEHFFTKESFRKFIEMTWYKSSPGLFDAQMSQKSAYVSDFYNRVKDLIQQSQQAGDIKLSADARKAALTISYLINGMYRVHFAMPRAGRKKADALQIFNAFIATLTS